MDKDEKKPKKPSINFEPVPGTSRDVPIVYSWSSVACGITTEKNTEENQNIPTKKIFKKKEADVESIEINYFEMESTENLSKSCEDNKQETPGKQINISESKKFQSVQPENTKSVNEVLLNVKQVKFGDVERDKSAVLQNYPEKMFFGSTEKEKEKNLLFTDHDSTMAILELFKSPEASPRQKFLKNEAYYAFMFRPREWKRRKREAISNLCEPVNMQPPCSDYIMYNTPVQIFHFYPDEEKGDYTCFSLSLCLKPENLLRVPFFVCEGSEASLSENMEPMHRNVFEIVSCGRDMTGHPVNYKSTVYFKVYDTDKMKNLYLCCMNSNRNTNGLLFVTETLNHFCEFEILPLDPADNWKYAQIRAPLYLKHVISRNFVVSDLSQFVYNIIAKEKCVHSSPYIDNYNLYWVLSHGSSSSATLNFDEQQNNQTFNKNSSQESSLISSEMSYLVQIYDEAPLDLTKQDESISNRDIKQSIGNVNVDASQKSTDVSFEMPSLVQVFDKKPMDLTIKNEENIDVDASQKSRVSFKMPSFVKVFDKKHLNLITQNQEKFISKQNSEITNVDASQNLIIMPSKMPSLVQVSDEAPLNLTIQNEERISNVDASERSTIQVLDEKPTDKKEEISDYLEITMETSDTPIKIHSYVDKKRTNVMEPEIRSPAGPIWPYPQNDQQVQGPVMEISSNTAPVVWAIPHESVRQISDFFGRPVDSVIGTKCLPLQKKVSAGVSSASTQTKSEISYREIIDKQIKKSSGEPVDTRSVSFHLEEINRHSSMTDTNFPIAFPTHSQEITLDDSIFPEAQRSSLQVNLENVSERSEEFGMDIDVGSTREKRRKKKCWPQCRFCCKKPD